MKALIENSQAVEAVQPLLINCEQLARMLGVSKGWVYQHKIIGTQKVGGALRFSREQIQAAVATGRSILVNN